MANVIKIKRGEAATAPSALRRGEFGFSEGTAGAALNLHIGWGAEDASTNLAANITRIGSNFGITDTDAVQIDGADIATGEYAKFTASGLQSRTTGEVLSDIGADAAGTDNSTNVSLAGTPDYITAGGTGNQTLTLGQVVLTTDVSGVLPAANTQKLNDLTSPDGSVSMNSQKITGLAAPVLPSDAARKADVDAAVQGLDVHDSVRVLSSVDLPAGNIASNSGAYTIDDVVLVATDRVLLQNQTPPSENGIYVVNTPSGSTHSMQRASDANAAADLSANMFFFVEEGTDYKDTGWVCTTNETLTLANMVFAQFSGTGSYTAGDGLDLTGTAFSLDLKANGGLVIDTGEIKVDLSASGIAGTLDIPDGGTGLADFTAGDLLYGKGTGENSFSTLAAGTDKYILTNSSGTPAWTNAPDALTIDCGTF
jgi:hypothetical protein